MPGAVRGTPCRRIYIIGAAGAGKTTLAMRLGARLGYPVVHLDRLFLWPGTVTAADERDALIAAWCARPCWIVEGAYPSWIEEFAAASDLIVWLDVPFQTAVWRMLRRYLLKDLRRHALLTTWYRLRRSVAYYTEADSGEDSSRFAFDSLLRARIATRSRAHAHKVLRLTHGGRRRLVARVLARCGVPRASLGSNRRLR